jgi:hypothetical protein
MHGSQGAAVVQGAPEMALKAQEMEVDCGIGNPLQPKLGLKDEEISSVGVRVWRTKGHIKNTSRMSCLICHANHSATYWKRNSFTIKKTGRNWANGAEQWGVSCFLWNMAKACQSACEPKALQSVRLWLRKWLHKTSYQSHAKRNSNGKPKSIFG